MRRSEPTAWTRPQQVATAAYGLWAAILTPLVAVFLENPGRTDPIARRQGYPAEQIMTQDHGYHSGLALVAVECVVYLVLAVLAWRGVRRVFWSCLVVFGFDGLGALWVPLRPAAHEGLDTLTIAMHAFVTDLPGLILAVWLVVGLARYGRPWASRPQHTKALVHV